ncbi:hypothetical protein FQN50_005715 [Emmonsiellopsis sp. PD_5]|nr:hypothetical protein FQN50_005715 [Emmonsiellopsis sp. PD_5]
MDFVKNLASGNDRKEEQPPKKEGGGLFGGLGDKLNAAAGGGRESEKKEDMLDKGIDYVQEHVLHQGKQDNESAFEQAKDEKIADFIRGQYKSQTGKEFPVKDKQ